MTALASADRRRRTWPPEGTLRSRSSRSSSTRRPRSRRADSTRSSPIVLRAGGGLPAARPGHPPPRRAGGHPRQVRSVRCGGEPRGLRALLLSGGPPRRAPGRALSRTLRPDREVLPDKGRFFLQTTVFGRSMIPAERIDIRAPRGSDAWYLALLGPPVSRLLAPPWPGADHRQRRAALPPRVERERPARVHRGHPPAAEVLRGAEPREDAAQAPASAALALEPRFPARVHLGRQRRQRLPRARAAVPQSAGVREQASPSG